MSNEIAASLNLRAAEGVPVVNSRDVAAAFGKDHRHVLRDIDGILHSPDLGGGWFREIRTEHPTVTGRLDRSFDLTRDGFTLLAMGWTGERAMAFKVQYIQAFNAMDDALRGASMNSGSLAAMAELIKIGVREIVAPLAVRFDGTDRAIERVERRQDALAEDLAFVKQSLAARRRNISDAVKAQHVRDSRDLGGGCPCCRRAEVAVVDMNGVKSPFADFDHFYANSMPDVNHTWLICKPCHSDLTTGRVPRDHRDSVFRAYQDQRRRLPGRQPGLFG